MLAQSTGRRSLLGSVLTWTSTPAGTHSRLLPKSAENWAAIPPRFAEFSQHLKFRVLYSGRLNHSESPPNLPQSQHTDCSLPEAAAQSLHNHSMQHAILRMEHSVLPLDSRSSIPQKLRRICARMALRALFRSMGRFPGAQLLDTAGNGPLRVPAQYCAHWPLHSFSRLPRLSDSRRGLRRVRHTWRCAVLVARVTRWLAMRCDESFARSPAGPSIAMRHWGAIATASCACRAPRIPRVTWSHHPCDLSRQRSCIPAPQCPRRTAHHRLYTQGGGATPPG